MAAASVEEKKARSVFGMLIFTFFLNKDLISSYYNKNSGQYTAWNNRRTNVGYFFGSWTRFEF